VLYNGVANTGIQNNIGYLSAQIHIIQTVFWYMPSPVPLCFYNEQAYELQNEIEEEGNWRLSDNDYSNCPNDGTYPFLVTYAIPHLGCVRSSTYPVSGSGYVRFYAAENENMLIGECLVTVSLDEGDNDEGEIGWSSSSGIIDRGVPSASIVALITIGSLAALLLWWRRRELKKAPLSEDHETSFRQMTSHDGTYRQ
jgi:hypothetical protein